MERIKGYLEYKLDLELCGVNTFEKDDKIRERYEQYLKDKQQDIKTNSKKDNNKKRQYNLRKNTLEYKERKETMILDDNIVDKQMVEKENFDGNNYVDGVAVKFDLQNGGSSVLAFCNSKHTAQAIAEALNLLDNIEGDGITLIKKKGRKQ